MKTQQIERYFAILLKLISGEKLTTKMLASEFNVSVRSIQRDFKKTLPLEFQSHLLKDKHAYYLDSTFTTAIFPESIKKYLSLIDSENVLPHKFTQGTLQTLLTYTKDTAPFLVQSSRRSVLNEYNKQIYALLEKAIKQCSFISFLYKKTNEDKYYQNIAPYRLIDYQGIWYLAALDNTKIKTFVLNKIMSPSLSKQKFTQEQKVIKLIEQDDSIWLSEQKFEVQLLINQEYADYFTRRSVIPNQVTELNENKTVTVTVSVTDFKEILPILRFWLPAIDAIEPTVLKELLIEEYELFKNKLK